MSPIRSYRRSSVWTLTGVVLLGVIASFLLAFNLRDRERRLFEVEFDHRAHERAIVIERELHEQSTHVESIAGFYMASDVVGRAQFRAFVKSVLETHSAIQGLGFDRVIEREDRAAHEAAVRLQGNPHYRITERAPDGSLVPAEVREAHVVVTILEPLEGNEAALGYDIASEPGRREALARARDTGRTAITGRLTLVQDTAGQFGALICTPIYTGEDPGAVEARRERIEGFAVGVVRIGDIVENALEGLRPTGIHLRITDETAPAGQRLLYEHRSRAVPPFEAGEAQELEPRPEHSRSYRIEIAGRLWGVEATPTPALVAKHRSLAPAGALLGGLLITALLVGYLYWKTSQNERLRRAVLERNRAEAQRADFGRVLDESHDEIYVADADSLRFLHVNRGALRNTGYAMEELRDLTPLELVPRMNPDSLRALLSPLRDGSRHKVEFNTIHRRKNGSEYDVDVHVQLATFDGAPAFVAVILDITDRKRIEERMRQSQRLEALGILAGGTAHDVNNLLMAIMGNTELSLAEVPPESPARRYLQRVLKATERARDVVRQILTFSRRHPIERRSIELREVVGEAVQLMRTSLPATISVRENLSDACMIHGDPTQIHQVLMNLCTNAAHAMRGRDGILEVRVDAVELDAAEAARLGDLPPGPYSRITVRDNGHGIPLEVRDRIFDPFFTTKDQGEGTGMGLSVAHGIVTGHGGTIRATSDVGRGTTLETFLPRLDAARVDPPAAEAESEAGGERILVVDDDPTIADLVTEMLEASGYVAEAYRSGAEALEVFRARPGEFDLVMTDYSMPGMTGAALARELALLLPPVPVILVSGYGDLLEEQEIRESGVRELLTKPLGRLELTASIRRTLDVVSATNLR